MAELDLVTRTLLSVAPDGLLSVAPDGLLAAAWGPGTRVVRSLDPHRVTLRVRDGLFELRGRPALAHLEVEARPRATSGRRAFVYWCQAQVGRTRPIRTLVVYLRPSLRRKPAREHRTRDGAGKPMTFGFDTLCLWELDAEAALARGDPELLPWLPFMRGATRTCVQQALAAVVGSRRSDHVRGELAVALAVFAGDVFPQGRWMARIPGDVRVASSTYREILTLGHKEGLEEGRKLLRDALTGWLRARWGALDASTLARLDAASARDLARWSERVVDAERLEDVLGGRRRGRKARGG